MDTMVISRRLCGRVKRRKQDGPPIPGSVAYGNEQEDNEKVEHEHTASVISLTDFLEKYSGYLSLCLLLTKNTAWILLASKIIQ